MSAAQQQQLYDSLSPAAQRIYGWLIGAAPRDTLPIESLAEDYDDFRAAVDCRCGILDDWATDIIENRELLEPDETSERLASIAEDRLRLASLAKRVAKLHVRQRLKAA